MGREQTSATLREHRLWTNLGSVHKLLGVVVVDAVNLQKGIRLAEEVLRREQHDGIVQQELRQTNEARLVKEKIFYFLVVVQYEPH